MKGISKIKNIVTDRRFILFICGWLSAFFFAGIVYFLINTQLFLDHFDAWIQTIGTLIGSFAGAALAGWFALKTVRYQLVKMEEKERQKKDEENLKVVDEYTSRIQTMVVFYYENFNDIPREVFESDNEGITVTTHNIDKLINLSDFIDNSISNLAKVDCTRVERKVSQDLITANAVLNFCLISVKSAMNFYNEIGHGDGKQRYLYMRNDLDNAFKKLEDILITLNKHYK